MRSGDDEPTEDREPRRRRSDDAGQGRGLPSGFTTLRDLISFVAGMVIIVNEAFFSPTIELYAMGAGLALCGLPLVFGADERKSR